MTEMDGMDRKIEKKGISRKMIWYLIFGALMITVLAVIIFGDKSSKYNVDVSRITIEGVKQDIFQDYITVQGTVEPITTIYLDAVEGGSVQEILIELAEQRLATSPLVPKKKLKKISKRKRN